MLSYRIDTPIGPKSSKHHIPAGAVVSIHDLPDFIADELDSLVASGAIARVGNDGAPTIMTAFDVAGAPDHLAIAVVINGRDLGTFTDPADALAAAIGEAERLEGDLRVVELQADKLSEALDKAAAETKADMAQIEELNEAIKAAQADPTAKVAPADKPAVKPAAAKTKAA